MEDIPLCYKGVIKSNQLEFFLSQELYNINKEIIEKEEKTILYKAKLNNLEEYFLKFKDILENNTYSAKIALEMKTINNVDYKNIFKIEIMEEYLIILKILQKIITFSLLKRNIYNTPIYLPCFLDNRERQYYTTLISPTFYKVFRFLYELSIKKEFIHLEQSIFYNKIMAYSDTVEEFQLKTTRCYIAIILFIEIGKFFPENNENFFIKTEELIK